MTWDGEGLTQNWSEGLNWSTNTVPTDLDSVRYDATSNKPCVIDVANAQVQNFTVVHGGYLATISTTGQLTITSTASLIGGSFNGGTITIAQFGALNIQGNLTLTNGVTLENNKIRVRPAGSSVTLPLKRARS